jgi:hypothetical protein
MDYFEVLEMAFKKHNVTYTDFIENDRCYYKLMKNGIDFSQHSATIDKDLSDEENIIQLRKRLVTLLLSYAVYGWMEQLYKTELVANG